MIIEMGVILWLVFVFITIVLIVRRMVAWSDREKKTMGYVIQCEETEKKTHPLMMTRENLTDLNTSFGSFSFYYAYLHTL